MITMLEEVIIQGLMVVREVLAITMSGKKMFNMYILIFFSDTIFGVIFYKAKKLSTCKNLFI